MDPNANLTEALKLARHIVSAVDADRWIESDVTDAARLAELVVGMDEWIRAGGFLPEVWDDNWQPEEEDEVPAAFDIRQLLGE